MNVSIVSTDGLSLLQSSTQMATPDGAGMAQARFPVRLPAQRWMVIEATLEGQDDMPWDNRRDQLVEMRTAPGSDVDASAREAAASRFLKLALDPAEGRTDAWPLVVKQSDVVPREDGASRADC